MKGLPARPCGRCVFCCRRVQTKPAKAGANDVTLFYFAGHGIRGNAPDGRKVKGTMHWVSAAHSVPAEVRIYTQLFSKPGPDASNFAADLNSQSLEVLADARVEPALAGDNSDNAVQFERQGYFCRDRDSKPGRLVFNRTVGLRDTWAKVSGG